MANLNFIEQNSAKNLVATKTESKLELIKKLTHLYMHDKFIQKIGNLAACESLQVLYLHNNDILKIFNLEPLKTLKHLYLQKNRLRKIEGLTTLKQLKKCYLGYNEISVIEGLEKLVNLEELHIERQRLYKGENLCFDPRSIKSLSNCLHTLNISGNNITTIVNLEPLINLRVVNASYNNIIDVNEVAKVIHNWFYLADLNFIGNPMSKQHRYKDTIIANTFRLAILDDKDINDTQRDFIKRFEQHSLNRMCSNTRFRQPRNIPGRIPPQLQNTITKSVVKNLSSHVLTTSLNDEMDTYLPWRALRLKQSVSDSGKTIPPLFIKQQQQQQRQRKPEPKRVQFAPVFPQLQ